MLVRSLALLAGAAALLLPLAATSQSDPGACIVAGRLGTDGHWAPRLQHIELLGQDGRRVVGGRTAVTATKQVRLTEPALLSRCDGGAPLARADDEPAGTKQPVPALSPGLVDVDGVAFSPLRASGELVELKVRYAADRVVMVTR